MEDFQKYLNLINNCDPENPLLSTTSLGKRLDEIYLENVDQSDLNDLNQALNVEQLIPTEEGLARDYRGLAEIMGFSSVQTESCFKRSLNPTKSLIDSYINLSITRKDKKPVTVNDLLKMLEQIERFDVIDDFLKTLIKLASNSSLTIKKYQHNTQRGPLELENLRGERSILTSSDSNDNQLVNQKFDQLTLDDLPNSAIIYDAFICFAPEDMKYAQQLTTFLESVGKRVVTVDDILPGHFEHDALIRLIDERCRKVITVLTPNFLRSKECEFQTKFANEVGLKADCRKIIPVLFEHCDYSKLPSLIKVLSKIDMTTYGSHQWQMKRLVRSLGVTEEINDFREASKFRNPPAHQTLPTPTDHAITCSRDTSQAAHITISSYENPAPSGFQHSSGGGEPIVDLLHSQDSAHLTSSAESASNFSMTSSSSQSPDFKLTPDRDIILTSNVNKVSTKGWLQAFKRKVLGSSSNIDSVDASSSSKAYLITSNYADFLEDTNHTGSNDKS